jgi:hypothetical protein
MLAGPGLAGTGAPKMNRIWSLRLAVVITGILGIAGCNDDGDDVTGSRGSLAAVEVEAPGTAQSGVEFGVDLAAANIGVSNIRNGRVEVTLDAPLFVLSVDPSSGTTAAVVGNRITWDLGTLDANTRSRLTARVRGTLSPGEGSRMATIQAELTGQGVSAGDAVATDTVTINP